MTNIGLQRLLVGLTIGSMSISPAPAVGQVTARPTIGVAVNPPLAASAVPGPVVHIGGGAPALTPAGEAYLRDRLRTYLADRSAQLIAVTVLTQSRVSPQADAVEQAFDADGRRVAAHHIGRAVPAAAPQRPIDPGALEGARVAAQHRWGRAPTQAEVAAELAAFDQRVARVNRDLAAQHAVIAAEYQRSGEFPRDLEAPLLGVRPRGVALDQLPSADRALLKAALVTLINNAAGKTPPPVAVPR